ncbi:MAG: isoleucine--tRNA ligase [Candidatus Micrarchaeota archaeon]
MLVYNQSEIEAQILEFWEAKRIPQRLAEQRRDAKPFFLLDGPPYANAQPHIGHVKTTVCKDIWSRYKQMKGFRSYFQAGFDCHGLPTEVMVEKELGITSKGDIEKIGIEKFDAKCLEKVLNTEKVWMDYYRRLGAWRFYAEPYFTYKDYYIESGWWTVKQLHEQGLLVEGEKPVYWCPHCETALSGYEVSDSYKDMPDPSIFVKFKIKAANNEYLLVWTTTPWTLPGNVSVVVHPSEVYVKAKVGNDILIIAEKRVEAVLKEKLGAQYQILEKMKGEELEGLEYEPLLDVPQQHELGESGRRVHLSIPIMTEKKYKKHKLVHKKDEPKPEGAVETIKAAINPAATAQPAKIDVDKITGTEEREEFEEFVTMAEGTGLVHCAPGHGQTDFYIGKYYNLPVVSPVDEHGKFTEKAGEFAGIYVKTADDKIIAKLNAEGKMLISERLTHRAALCWRCKTALIFRLSKQWYLKAGPLKDKMISENSRHVKWMPPYGKLKFHNWLVDREDWAISQQRYWGIPLPIWICSGCGKFDVIGSKEELKQRSIAKLNDSDLTDLHRHTVDKIALKCKSCGASMGRVRDILNVWFDSGIAPWASLGYPFKNKALFESMFPADLITESQDQIRGWFDSLLFASVGVFGKSPYKSVGMMGWVLDEKGEKMSKSIGNVIPAIEGIQKLSADVIRMYYCYEIAPWEVQKFSYKTAEEVRKVYAILFNTYAFYKTYSEGVRVGAFSKISLRPEDAWIIAKLNILKQRVTEAIDAFEFHSAGRAMLKFLVDDFSRTYIKLIRDRVSLPEASTDKLNCLAVIRHVLLEYSKLLAPISPFISEHLYQQLRDMADKESVHYCDYPQIKEDEVDLSLVARFEMVARITEAANSLRQDFKMKLRWPLEELIVYGDDKVADAVESLQEVLKLSNNAEKVEFGESIDHASKEFDGGRVFIPRKMSDTAILRSAVREISRAIQAARKKNNFVVSDRIAITLSANSQPLREFLSTAKDSLAKDVGGSSIELKMLDSELHGDIVLEVGLSGLKEGMKATVKFSKA